MYLAVEKATADNHKKLPVGYPLRCSEMPDGTPCPDGCEAMTVEELEESKKSFSTQYKDWKENIFNPHVKILNKEQEIYKKIHDRLDEYVSIGNKQDLEKEQIIERDLILKELEAQSDKMEKIKI